MARFLMSQTHVIADHLQNAMARRRRYCLEWCWGCALAGEGDTDCVRQGRTFDTEAYVVRSKFDLHRRCDTCRTQRMPGYAGRTDLSLRVAGNVLIGMCKRPCLRGKEDDRQQNA